MILINTPIKKLQNKKDLGELENSLKATCCLINLFSLFTTCSFMDNWYTDETASLGNEYENIEKSSSSRFSMIFIKSSDKSYEIQ